MESKNTIEYFELDLDIYMEIHEGSKRLKKSIEEYIKVFPTYERLSEDIYLALFKAMPKIKSSKEINVEYKFNNRLITKLFETDEFDSYRKSCNVNYFNSLLGSELIGKYFIQNYIKFINNNNDFKSQVASYEKALFSYKRALSDYKKLCLEYRSSKDELKLQESKLMKEKITSFETSIENSINDLEKSILSSNILYKSVSAAYKEFIGINSTIKSWGLNDGKMTPTSYDEKVEVAIKLKGLKKVKQISEMAGRFKASASQLQKRRTREEGQEICGVKLGDEIHKVLPSEKLLLANEITKKSFYKKYHQKELLSYKYKNNRIKSKGPIICCIDTSSSMEGELEVWSKSVAIALLDIAFKQKRDFVGILFSYKVGQVIEFNKRKIEPRKMYDLATGFIGSGTNFVEPLTEAMKLINTAKYKYADIIFITDGKAPLDEDFIEEFILNKEKKQFRMITVNVADNIEEGLNKINDTQILLRELTNEAVEATNETLFTL
ncbi:vWA domain-containing protein [Clostridium cylindrosporum]|uniref:von willebrand factor type A domain-containing protein n=1 Tax=Clostridium cylindrosporum DSM 605 TaxID=1121307 RepID=A0A0J8DBF6_CLOCY|nr:hypothetical protein [Clostridium cylindrosporum]KMT23172.1 von willebrand factor type A domain-containing protein [Clostridium cylindrosporum DSM 605]